MCSLRSASVPSASMTQTIECERRRRGEERLRRREGRGAISENARTAAAIWEQRGEHEEPPTARATASNDHTQWARARKCRSTEESSYQSVHLRGSAVHAARRGAARRKSHSPIRALAPHTTLHATQRNATQHNTTQRNATQRNATQRNTTQRKPEGRDTAPEAAATATPRARRGPRRPPL